MRTENPCFNPNCPACVGRRVHSAAEWKNHKFAGHGRTKEMGWTHPELATEIVTAQNVQNSVQPKDRSGRLSG